MSEQPSTPVQPVRFVYIGNDLALEAEFPGTRIIGPVKFRYRPWREGDWMDSNNLRAELTRRESRVLDGLRAKAANARTDAEREKITREIEDEQRRVNIAVQILLDFETLKACLVDHDIVKPGATPADPPVKVDLADLAEFKRIPPNVIRYMTDIIMETFSPVAVPVGAAGTIETELGK